MRCYIDRRNLKFFWVVFCILSCIILCSWADPVTNDLYTGYLIYNDTQGLPVTRLSGSVEYILDSYDSVGYADNGQSIYNHSGYQVLGEVRVGSTVYNARLQAFGGLEIQQSYYSGNTLRSAWISYDLRPDLLPSGFSLVELSLIFLVMLLVVSVGISILQRGVIG